MIKCIIWDLDETLWNGTLAENEEIELKTNIINIIKELSKRGIVMSIASKNNFDQVKRQLKEFNLWEYFVFPQCSWEEKYKSIKLILDNFKLQPIHTAFIDDSPFERNLVNIYYPEIKTIDAKDYQSLLTQKCFMTNNADIELNRLQTYKQIEKRINDERNWQGTMEEFLYRCNITLNISLANNKDINRIEELSIRANQFNSSLKRYNSKGLKKIIEKDFYSISIVELEDIYGSYGVVGFIIIKKSIETAEYFIESLVLSCKIQGRGIGMAFLAEILNQIFRCGAQKVFIRVPKKDNNSRPINILLRLAGFRRHSDELLVIENNKLLEAAKWIKIKNKEGEKYEIN
ncbi:HAD-IIIC family phosphatase [Bacillus velezensis]|uniref:HAD-IIIC family phosphatase n=1 Tax=Bacillus velezensis TaxID=492670 RepID=UPI0039B0BBD8